MKKNIDYGVFQNAIGYGIIDVSNLETECENMRRKEALSKHEYATWQGDNGYWYTYFPDGSKKNKRRQVCKKNKQDLEDTIIEFYRNAEDNPTIENVFIEWEDHRVELNQIALSTRSRDERCFYRHFSEWGQRRIKDVAPMEFADFLEREAAQKNLDNKAYNNLKGIVKGFLKRAKRRGLINYNINDTLEVIELPRGGYGKKKKKDSEEVYNDNEVKRIISYLLENLDSTNTGLLLVFTTGIRIGELTALNHDDFNGDGTFNVAKTESMYKNKDGDNVYIIRDTAKTEAGVRTVIIPKDYAWIEQKIQSLNQGGKCVFLNTKNVRATGDTFRSRMRTICKNLDMPYRSPHKIRKTYGSILLDNRVNEKVITAQMGHTSINCTENYYHKDRTTKEQRIDIISCIPELSLLNQTQSNAN